MLIDIKTISQSKDALLAIETEISPEELDLKSLGYQLVRPLAFHGTLQNMGDGILSLTGQLETAYEGDCARCLVSVQRPLSIRIAERYLPAAMPAGEDNETDYRYTGGHLEIGQAIRDSVLPALPGRLICKPDCQGLCPDCGANLNEKECGCAAGREGMASPFDKLKELL